MAEMNNEFKIILVNDFYGGKGNIDATFYINVEGKIFPGNAWTDFVIVVLNWWIVSIIEVFFQEKSEFTLQFMDGPYYVECIREGERVHMSFIEDQKQAVSVCECEIQFSELVNKVVMVSSDLIQMLKTKYKRKVCRLNGIKEIKKSLKQLKKIC